MIKIRKSRITELENKLVKCSNLPPVLIADVDKQGFFVLDKTFKSENDMTNFLNGLYKNQKYILIIDNLTG